ncbi:hypothetical protein [Porphyromonas loveana]|uniref:hypothetical protein n=1 Tax=Porphyromonas loveana TaxID=1884669 RepID=UPI00359FB86D
MELLLVIFFGFLIYWVIRFLIRVVAIRRMFFNPRGERPRGEPQEPKVPAPGEKVELEELEKRRFNKDQGEYVDFEDIKDR